MKKLLALSIASAISFGAFATSPPVPLELYKQQQAKKKIVLPDILKPGHIEPQVHQNNFVREGPTVQVAILIDSSNSMDGLIYQVKNQIWTIVNEISKANKDNKDVVLQVALFEFGKQSLSHHEGYVQQLSSFTSDLDQVSESLFNLTTNGGDEYAGRVILESVNRLAWSNHPDDMKMIIIAGNEGFDQGQTPFAYAIDKAVSKNITVNTVFCGPYGRGVAQKWSKGAARGRGKYLNIAQNDRIKHIISPYDDRINSLGAELNSTYINYGEEGKMKKSRQIAMDEMAESESVAVSAQRNMAKVSNSYDAKSWDIVSLFSKGSEKEAVKALSTSDAFKGMSEEEALAKIKENAEKRDAVEREIKSLQRMREEYIQKQDKGEDKTFGTVLVKEFKKQAKNKGYTFEND